MSLENDNPTTTNDAPPEAENLLTGSQPDQVAADPANTDTTDPANADPAAEIEYKFEAPEGSELDQALLDEATPLFKEAKLTQEQAQKFVDLHAKQVQSATQRQEAVLNEQSTKWLEAVKADKEIGGENLTKSVQAARLAISKISPGLESVITETGLGNNPDLLRLAVYASKALQEDNPGNADNNATEKKDRVSILYPTN